ncbi:MAG: PAS domain S-box protein [Janthinobacterium lividum]
MIFHTLLSVETIRLVLFLRPYCFSLISGLLILKLVDINNKTIKEREEDFQNIYLGNPNPMWIYDPVSFQFLSVNKAAISVYGYTEKEFLEMTIKNIRSSEDQEKVMDSSSQITDTNFTTGLWKHLKKDGNLIYVNITSHKIRFFKKTAIMVLAADTTEQVQYEQQLQQMNEVLHEEKQKLKETEKLAKVSGWEYFVESGELIWSEELYRIFDLDPSEKISYRKVLETVYPEDLPIYNKSVESLLLFGHDLDIEYRYLKKNGETKYVKVLGKMQYQNGKMFKVQGTMQDVSELKLIQLEKNKYSQLLTNTLENINDGYCQINRNWFFTDVNLNCEKLLNLKREDIIGHYYLDLFPEAGNWKFYSQFKKVLEENIFVSFEEYFYPTNSWLCVNAYPTDEGAAIYFTDITENKKKDLLLKEALERYDLVAKATRDVIYDYDVRRRSIKYSDNITELMGLNQDQIHQGIDWWKSRIHADDLSKVINVYQRAIHYKEQNCGMEYRLKTANHEYKYVYDQGYLQFDAKGKFMRMIGAIKDIDQLKRFDDENKRLAEIITKVNNMIIIQDVNNKITWVNKAFENSTGYALHEVMGKYPQDILNGPETDLDITKLIVAGKIKLQNFSYEIINYTKTGKKYWVNVEFTPLFTPAGKPDGYISIHNDITLRKEKAEKISRQNEILRNIAWMSSHELRRPVASILGLIGLINETTDDEERKEAIGMMNTCTKQLDEIIHTINYKIEKEITGK